MYAQCPLCMPRCPLCMPSVLYIVSSVLFECQVTTMYIYCLLCTSSVLYVYLLSSMYVNRVLYVYKEGYRIQSQIQNFKNIWRSQQDLQ